MVLSSFILLVSFQNCSISFWNLNNSKQTKASDINEMLMSSEKEIVTTKAALDKSMSRQGGFEKLDLPKRLVVRRANLDTKNFKNEVQIKLKPATRDKFKK